MSQIIFKPLDKPPFIKILLSAFQQLLAILAATITVPTIVNSTTGAQMSQSAALIGAGVGTIIYLFFTKFKSPVFFGSSFAFIGSMCSAFAGAVTMSAGYLGLIIGAFFVCILYVGLSLLIKKFGTNWLNKVMPPVIIGPTVAIIGLTLAPNAISDLVQGSVPTTNTYVALLCGLITLFVTIACSVYGKKTIKMIPFIIGIGAGYLVATIFTIIGIASKNDSLKVINFDTFNNMKWVPEFTFVEAFKSFKDFESAGQFFSYLGTIALGYLPVAFVAFAEHVADHKNLSQIIGSDLLEDPGLDKTLMGEGVGSFAGVLFGGCPNTTYGESVGCVALSGNASTITILVTCIIAILISFFAPFVTFLATIPHCVMGGVCIALYGFIAVSGLKMIQKVDLDDNKNLFVISSILIAGIGGLVLNFGKISITQIACALILGILVNILVHIKKDDKDNTEEDKKEDLD